MTKRLYAKNGLPIWNVSLKSSRTGEKIRLEIAAETNEEATRKCSKLYGYEGDYEWLGTDPLYKEEKGR